MDNSVWYISFVITVYIFALFCCVLALWRSRTAQGTTAWIVALLAFPFLTIPFFIVFGRNKFLIPNRKRQLADKNILAQIDTIKRMAKYECDFEQTSLFAQLNEIARKDSQMKTTKGNQLELLLNGEKTYTQIKADIEKAQNYILFQFYIFKSDTTSIQFKDLLIKKAKEGVKVYFMYDYVGSSVSRKILTDMKQSGIVCAPFKISKKTFLKTQINFRNHRKVVVVDGHTAFIGGHNIGDEYLGLDKKLTPWRDTHLKMVGPSALAAQISFAKDWFWVTGGLPNLTWELAPEKISDTTPSHAVVLHTGPADSVEASLLSHISLVNSAKKSIYISNPYFLPPGSLMNALFLARLRGVEIHVIVPELSDNLIVSTPSEIYLEKLFNCGAHIYKYTQGFPHQKTMLIDDTIGVVGSTNLDSRSIFINFEIQCIFDHENCLEELKKPFTEDLKHSRKLTADDFKNRSFIRQVIERSLNLLSPML